MRESKWVVYILKCSDGSFYTGCTNNIEKRLQTHRQGKGSKYVRAHLPADLAYVSEKFLTRGMAQCLECSIKSMTHKEKQELVLEGGLASLRKIFSGEQS